MKTQSSRIKEGYFFSKSSQKVLDFLCQRPQESFYSAQIASEIFLSNGGTNQILREMAQQGLLEAQEKGRMIFYGVNLKSPVVKQFKIFHNILQLEGIAEEFKPFAERIVLFGSCARGEDSTESDIDMLVVSLNKKGVAGVLSRNKFKRKLQLIVKTPQELIALERNEPVFFGEIERGIVLWERE